MEILRGSQNPRFMVQVYRLPLLALSPQPNSIPKYIASYDNDAPKEQIIQTDTTSMLIRSLTQKRRQLSVPPQQPTDQNVNLNPNPNVYPNINPRRIHIFEEDIKGKRPAEVGEFGESEEPVNKRIKTTTTGDHCLRSSTSLQSAHILPSTSWPQTTPMDQTSSNTTNSVQTTCVDDMIKLSALHTMTKLQLQDLLNLCRLPTSGNKAHLISRLRHYKLKNNK